MGISIDWLAFVQVFAAALIGALLVVGFYARSSAAGAWRTGAHRRSRGVHRRDHGDQREGGASCGQSRREGGEEEP
jgi:hypothetical protein